MRQYPHTGRVRDDLRPGLRSLPVGRYVVNYRALEDAVEVVSVVHSSRDIEAMFDDGA